MSRENEPFEETAGAEEDRVLSGTEKEIHVDANVSKCPTCGANLVYSPTLKKLHCEYCGGNVDIDLTDYAEEVPFDRLTHTYEDWST